MPDPDLSEFAALSVKPRRPCPLGAAINQLADKSDVAKVRAALAKPVTEISNAAISRWFAARDVNAHCNVIRSHRRCDCDA